MMLMTIDDKLREFADRVFKALGYYRHPPPVRLTRIVIVRVPERQRQALAPFPSRVQPNALITRRQFWQ